MTKSITKNKLSAAILAILIATTMAFSASAGKRRGDGQGYGKGERGFPMLASLNLTDTQQKKIDALEKKKRDEIDKVRKEMAKLQAQVRAQWEKEPVDKNKLKSLHKKMQSLHTKIADARLNFRLGVTDVLTADQRKKAAAERKAWHQNRAQRRQNRGNDAFCDDRPHGDGHGRGNGRGRNKGKGRGHGRGDGRGPGFGHGTGMGPVW